MKNKLRITLSPLLAVGLLLFATGCESVHRYSLTCHVWDNSDFTNWSEPAPNLNLALFERTNDASLLVEYNEISEKHSTLKRRAFVLEPERVLPDEAIRPKWVDPSMAKCMTPIVVLPASYIATNQPFESFAYAVISPEGHGFTLYRPMQPAAAFDLPVYVESSGTPLRIVLTPFAVAGDALIVGAAAAVVAGVGVATMMAYSGASWAP